MTDQIRAPELNRYYRQVEVAEHEVLLTFVNDADAEDFNDWWNDEGFAAFKRDVEAMRRLR